MATSNVNGHTVVKASVTEQFIFLLGLEPPSVIIHIVSTNIAVGREGDRAGAVTIMVMVIVFLVGLFLWLLDWMLSSGFRFITGIGG